MFQTEGADVTNDLVPVDSLKNECVVLAKVQGVSEGAENVRFLKTLCSRGSVFEHALSRGGKKAKQRLEECHASAQALMNDYGDRPVKMDAALMLLEKAGVKHFVREDMFVSMKIVKCSLLNKRGVVLRVHEVLPGISARRMRSADPMCHWKTETVTKIFAVRMVIIPESAAQLIRWFVKRTDEEDLWRRLWQEERQEFMRLAEMIEFLAKRKNANGKTMDELVEMDMKKLRDMMKNGQLEGDGWKVQPNDYDWLMGRRGRRDVE